MKTLHLTDQQYEDLIYLAADGLTQIFDYTDPEVDWGMSQDEFDTWMNRMADAIRAARANAE